MDDKLAHQLVRQLKLLNFWLTLFGTLFLVALGIIGFLLWQVIVFAQNTAEQMQSFQQETSERLDVGSQLCKDEALGGFLRNSSDVCN